MSNVTTTIQVNGSNTAKKLKSVKTNDLQNNNIFKSQQHVEPVKYLNGLLQFRTEVVWQNAIGFLLIHLAGFYGVWLCLVQMWNLQFTSTLYMYFMGWLGGEGVTVGAHRLWTHRSYKARRPLRIILMICQTIAGENSCWTWVRDHRLHHKYTDTDADPHNASRGFFYSHIGWLMMKKHPDVKEKGKGIFLGDIEQDPVIMFQKKYFQWLFLVIGIIIPISIPCILWEENLWNSIFISFFFRYILLLNITWTVNSIAHIYGNRPYDKNILPTESKFVSIIGYGEGWHNYHHVFPWDYKASEYGISYNFTRTIIEFCEKIGWAYDLKEASEDMVMKRIYRTGDGTHFKFGHENDKKNVGGQKIKHDAAGDEQREWGW